MNYSTQFHLSTKLHILLMLLQIIAFIFIHLIEIKYINSMKSYLSQSKNQNKCK